MVAFSRYAQRRIALWRLPKAIREQIRQDARGLPATTVDAKLSIAACTSWLCTAQDQTRSRDGGVARHFSLLDGWSSSYPETTGYIVPTFLERAVILDDAELRMRARRMLDWLIKIQLENGAFQGGRIDSVPIVPVVFNTGQILLGLACGERTFGDFTEPMRRAADWLVSVQDADGCWRQFESPFALGGEKVYDTHTAWGLLEAARIEPSRGYAEAAIANVRWAVTHQRENGWLANCCLSDATAPLTHTLGYALRGILEAYLFSREESFLSATIRSADGLKSALRADGFLPGLLAADWSAAANWSCLTGTAQIAYCWLKLFEITGDEKYRVAAALANRYVMRTMRHSGPDTMRGAVGGSFPIDGKYCRFQYPNWAAKFVIDSVTLQVAIENRLHY